MDREFNSQSNPLITLCVLNYSENKPDDFVLKRVAMVARCAEYGRYVGLVVICVMVVKCGDEVDI